MNPWKSKEVQWDDDAHKRWFEQPLDVCLLALAFALAVLEAGDAQI